MATSDVGPVTTHNEILTPTVSTNTYLNLTLSFDIFYSRYYIDNSNPTLDYVTVDVSTDGGGAWIEIDRYLADIGYGTRFENRTYDLSAYINQPNFRVRIRYYAEWCDGLAIDNFQLFGDVPLNTAFQWSAVTPVQAFEDAACTVSYTPGNAITTVYIKPSLSQLEADTYEFTAIATLTNGCDVSQNVIIDNKSKVWKGTNSNDWNDSNNWLPVGIPDANTCVIIPDVTATNYSEIGGTNYNAFGRTLQVLADGELQLRSGNTVTIGNFVEVRGNGIFNIEDTASLIQIDDVANTGNINMDRDAVTNNTLDYVYWSTPVAGFSVNNVTPASTFRYQWEPTVPSAYAGDFGIWTAASGAMTTARGYIIRGSSGITTFKGVPNNGNITIPISRSTYQGIPYAGPTSTMVTEDDDNWNLLGNPYPSTISAVAFLAANSANLNQFVKIWTHGIDPSEAIADPFYQDFVLNYDVADYITYNALGGTQHGYDGFIGAGQGFFVLMNDAGATTENAIFNNAMRSNTYRNDQFFRTSEEITNALEKHRIWLKLIAPSGSSSDALVGYISDASNGYDTKYDAISGREKATFEIYSLLNNDTYAIQGKSLPFDENDIVPLGIVVPANGIYTIALSKTDGLFEGNQNIYLEDLEIGTIYDIKSTTYTFMVNSGRHNNRFILRYTNETLGNDDFITNNSIKVYTNNAINVKASSNIKTVMVYDVLGRTLGMINNVNDTEVSLKGIAKTQSPLVVIVELENGTKTTQKQ